MIKHIENKFIQKNIVIFLYIAMFWVYLARLGVFNGTVIATALLGAFYFTKNTYSILIYMCKSKFLYLFLLIWIPIILSALGSSSPIDSWRVVVNILRFFFICSLVVLLNNRSLKIIRKWILFFIVLISIDAVCEWLIGYHLLGKVRDINRIQGLFERYPLGYFMGTIAPLIIYQVYISFSVKSKWKYLWLGLALCTVLTIFVAGSRSGWIALIVGLSVFFFWLIIQNQVSLKKVPLIVCIVLIIGIGISQIHIVKSRIVNSDAIAELTVGSYEWFDKLSSSRLVLWEFAWKQYLAYPILGSGAGSFERNFSDQPKELKGVYEEANFVHFHGLEVLSETGIIGFVSYLSMLGWLFMMIMTSKKFPAWLVITFIAIMPINMHIALYSSFWAVICWIPLILGLRERYLLMQKDPANT